MPAAARAVEATPPPANWCRLALQISLVPPAPGRILSIDRGPKTLRVTVCCPRPMMWAGCVALLGSQPWIGQVLRWARAVLGW